MSVPAAGAAAAQTAAELAGAGIGVVITGLAGPERAAASASGASGEVVLVAVAAVAARAAAPAAADERRAERPAAVATEPAAAPAHDGPSSVLPSPPSAPFCSNVLQPTPRRPSCT